MMKETRGHKEMETEQCQGERREEEEMEVETATEERKGDRGMEGRNTMSTTMGTVVGEDIDMVKIEKEGEEMEVSAVEQLLGVEGEAMCRVVWSGKWWRKRQSGK